MVNLQMSNTFAAFQDICESIKVSPTAELLTNRGVINQVVSRVISLGLLYTNHCKYISYPLAKRYYGIIIVQGGGACLWLSWGTLANEFTSPQIFMQAFV